MLCGCEWEDEMSPVWASFDVFQEPLLYWWFIPRSHGRSVNKHESISSIGLNLMYKLGTNICFLLLLMLIWCMVRTARCNSNTQVEDDCVGALLWSEPRCWQLMVAVVVRPCHWYIMIVFAFVSGDNSFWIVWRSLHMFSHWASSSRAFIIAPTSTHLNRIS